jgi:hypothetical protein
LFLRQQKQNPKEAGGRVHGTLRKPFQSTGCSIQQGAVLSFGQGPSCRAVLQEIQFLGPFCGHALLPTGSGQEPTRDLRGVGLHHGKIEAPWDEGCPQEIDPLLRQYP